MPRAERNATVGAIAAPPSSFTAAAPVSFSSRAALANACSGDPSYEPKGISITTTA